MSDSLPVAPAELRRVPFLAGLDDAQLAALGRSARRVACAAGDAVFREGEPGRELFVILRGEIAIEKGSPARVVATLGPGTAFGEMGFLVGDVRTATARARSESGLVAFAKDDVDAIDGAGREAATVLVTTVARMLALRLAHLTTEMARLARRIENLPGEARDIGRTLGDKADRAAHEWTG